MAGSSHGSTRPSLTDGARGHGSLLYAVLFSVAILWPAGLIVGALTGSAEVLGLALVTALVAPMLMTALAAVGWWGGHHKAS